MSTDTALLVSAEYEAAIGREWARLARPSSFFTGAERVALAEEARRERTGDPTPTGGASQAAAEAARRLATKAMDIREDWVEDLEARGLGRLAYTEIVGLVSRVEAIDCFEFGVGRPLRDLPSPVPGEPTGEVDPEAAMNGAWVPTVGAPEAPVALSAIPNDHEALHDIHGAFFITAEQITEFGLVKDLIRPQMEIIAARTSMVNDCFY